MDAVETLDVLFSSMGFWLFFALFVVFTIVGGVSVVVSRVRYNRELRAYSAKAREQKRVRQEFRRIVNEGDL